MLLSQEETLRLLKKYTIKTPNTKIFTAEKELNKIKFPSVLKIDSPEIIHKTEFGVVYTNLSSLSSIKEKIKEAKTKLEKNKIKDYKFVLQEMVKGQEIIIGMKRDHTFGPVILFGLGGILVEVIKDVSMRISPLSKRDCMEMMDELQGKKLLDGYRNLSKPNKEKLADLLLKTSKLALKESNIIEIDFNPVIANQKEAVVVDARIIIQEKSTQKENEPMKSGGS